MDVTKLSTKGQIVIPEKLRKDLTPGTSFTVVKKGDLIILKKIEGITQEELEEMNELDEIWKDIDAGKGVSMSADDFFKEMKKW